jgi:hypothetical protein
MISSVLPALLAVEIGKEEEEGAGEGEDDGVGKSVCARVCAWL